MFYIVSKYTSPKSCSMHTPPNRTTAACCDAAALSPLSAPALLCLAAIFTKFSLALLEKTGAYFLLVAILVTTATDRAHIVRPNRPAIGMVSLTVLHCALRDAAWVEALDKGRTIASLEMPAPVNPPISIMLGKAAALGVATASSDSGSCADSFVTAATVSLASAVQSQMTTAAPCAQRGVGSSSSKHRCHTSTGPGGESLAAGDAVGSPSGGVTEAGATDRDHTSERILPSTFRPPDIYMRPAKLQVPCISRLPG